MKANSRRRVLISSLAMLLVALVALSTATFAWFSQNTKATASGISAKTTQSSNIVLSENGTEWTDKLVFKTFASGSMTPVTTANFTNWYTAMADAKDAGIKGANDYEDAVQNTDYTATDLYMKYESSDALATKKVKVTLNVTDNSEKSTSTDQFLRVALVPVDAATKGIQATNIVWGAAADDFALNKDKFTALDADNTGLSITTTTSKTLITSATLAANTEYHFDVYVWYEGTDPQCIDSKAVNDFTVDFEVTEVK